MIQLSVNLPGHAYPIHIGQNALAETAPLLAQECPGRKAAIVSDETVWELHGRYLEELLSRQGLRATTVLVPPGETSKSLSRLEYLYHAFYRCGLTRKDPVIAFGGGVVGDLAGFAAATYLRGLPFIQMPTTLLAQVDASVGGKVAVNLEEGKNLVGSFYQPVLVIADTTLLTTLPRREWKAGLAEVVKYAAIGEDKLGAILAASGGGKERLDEIIYLCCQSKARFVERDERDADERMMLNFGHTFGHAIERYHGFTKYNHGEAVAIGMALAARTGVLLGVSAPDTETKLIRLLETCELSYRLTDPFEELIPLMTGDKKNTGQDITLVLLKKIGAPLLYKIQPERLERLFKEDVQ